MGFSGPSFTAEDATFILTAQSKTTGWDIMRLNLTHEVPRLEPLLNDSFGEWGASLSPDGAWLAYANDKTGKARVYIRRYDPLGPPKMVSKTGGLDPQWSRDGSRLYYRKGRPFTLSTFSMRTEVSVIVNPLRCLNRL